VTLLFERPSASAGMRSMCADLLKWQLDIVQPSTNAAIHSLTDHKLVVGIPNHTNYTHGPFTPSLPRTTGGYWLVAK